jgi:hypothetical protein
MRFKILEIRKAETVVSAFPHFDKLDTDYQFFWGLNALFLNMHQ